MLKTFTKSVSLGLKNKLNSIIINQKNIKWKKQHKQTQAEKPQKDRYF